MAVAEKVDTRLQILKGCEGAMARYGYKRMTVDDIAAEAGLAKRTLYLHFRSKDAIVSETIDEMVRQSRAAMARAMDEEPSAEGKLRALLTERVLQRAQRVASYQATLDEVVQRLYGSPKEHLDYYGPEIEMIASAVKAGIDSGEFGQGKPEEIANVLVRATNAFMPSAMSAQQFQDAARMKARLKILVDLLIGGLKSAGATQ